MEPALAIFWRSGARRGFFFLYALALESGMDGEGSEMSRPRAKPFFGGGRGGGGLYSRDATC